MMKPAMSIALVYLSIGVIGILMLAIVMLFRAMLAEHDAQELAAIGTIMGALATTFLLLVIGYQAWKLRQSIQLQTTTADLQKMSIDLQKATADLQTAAFSLEKRPYVYVTLDYKIQVFGKGPEPRIVAGGGDLYFHNEGEVPASGIENSKYMVASDTRGVINFEKWFIEERNGFPHVTSVFPHQTKQFVPLHPIIGNTTTKKPKLLFVGAVITYTGIDPNKKYWYHFSRLCQINIDVEPPVVSVLKPVDEWDRGEHRAVPVLEEPDWDFFLPKLEK